MLDQIARRLREAMTGWGTDEEAIYSTLSSRTPDQVEAIARRYREQYHRDLSTHLQDELNEKELLHLGIFAPAGAPTSEGGTSTGR